MRLLKFFCLGLFAAGRFQLYAANDNWSGASNANFENAGNWSAGTPVNDLASTVGVFGGAPTANQPALTTSRSLNGLSFTTATGGWTLGTSNVNNLLTLGGGGITTAGQTTGTNFISANLALGANQTWQAGAGGTIVFTGSITNNPAAANALAINSGANLGTLILSPSAGNSVNLSGTNTAEILAARTGGTLVFGGDGTNAPVTTSTNQIKNFTGTDAFGLGSGGAVVVNSGTWNIGDAGRNNTGFGLGGTLNVNGGTIGFTGLRYVAGITINVSGGTFKSVSGGGFQSNAGRFGLGNWNTGGGATATMNVSGGFVDFAQANSGNTIGQLMNSLFNQSGGTVQNGITANGGSGGGTVTTFTIGPGGTTANISSAFTLTGGKFISAGAVQYGGSTGTGNVNNFNFMGGTLAVGAFNATGIGSSPTATFSANQTSSSVNIGTLVNYGGTLAPGDTNVAGETVITGNYAVSNDAAVLTVDLGGTTQATAFTNAAGNYDTVTVSGTATLGGSLRVNLINGFTPGLNESFNVLTSAGIGGAFTNVAFGSLITTTTGGIQLYVTTNSLGNLVLSRTFPSPLPDQIAAAQASVDALPATNNAQLLKNAVLNLALEQANEAYLVNYYTDASNRVNDVNAAMTNDANVMAAMTVNAPNIGSLVPIIETNWNPYLDCMQAGLATALATADTVLGKNTTNITIPVGTRDNGEYMEAYLFLFVNPVSSYRTNAEVLQRFLRLAHAYADTIDVHDAEYAGGSGMYDDFAIAPASGGFREFARLFPGLLLPSQKALWDRAMTKAGAKMWTKATTDGNRGRYANIDSLQAYQLLNFGLYLTNQPYLDKAKWLVDVRTNDLYPDGAWPYIWSENESHGYHGVDTENIGKYWLVTGYALCTNMLDKTSWYGPVSNGRGGEFWTAPSWKALWNGAGPDTGGEEAIAFSANPYTRWIEDNYNLPGAVRDTGNWSSRRWQATFYRGDVAAKPLPDNMNFVDRNIVGPSAWYGRFHYSINGRRMAANDPGQYTIAGAAIQETNATLWNAILMGVYPRVRAAMSTNTPTTDPSNNGWMQNWGWLTSQQTNDYTMGRDFSAVSATYRLHRYGSSTKGSEINWRGLQTWVCLPDRIIGWLTVKPDAATAQAYEVDGVVRLGTGGTVNSATKTVVDLGGGVYTYGDLRVTLYGHNYGSISADVMPFRLTGYPTTEITLQDSNSIPSNGTNLLTYQATNVFDFVVEVRPNVSAANAAVNYQTDANGIRTFTVTLSNATYLVVQNTRSNAFAYTTNIPCAYANAAWLNGWYAGSPQITPLTVSGGFATLSTTIPAGSHVLFVNSANAGLMQLGWSNAAAFFAANPVASALPPPWQSLDVGNVGQAGDASYSGGTFTLTGSGTGITGTADEFQYVYQPLTSNGGVIAYVAQPGNNSGTAAGVMIRDSLAPGAANAAMLLTTGTGAQFTRRTTLGGSTTTTTSGSYNAPYWVKIERNGSMLTGSVSANSTSWTQVGSATVTMGSDVYIGLAVTANNDSVLRTATFANVSLLSGSLVSPTGLAATPGPAQIGLTWNALPGATGYNVKRSVLNNGIYSTVANNVATTNFTDAGLTPGATYYYVISALNAGGESPDSTSVNATPLVVTPAQPPVIGNITLSGTNLIISGTNGTAGANYIVLTSTNLALPLANWAPVATNQFGAGGSFIFTNVINPARFQLFHLLKLP